MTVASEHTPASVDQTPAAQFSEEQTSRASDRFSDVLPATYDEKDDMGLLREKLQQRKKPIYAGLAFLCVVVIGVSVAVSTGGSTDASVSSGYVAPVETTAAPVVAPVVDESATAGVHAADDMSASGSSSSSGSVAGEATMEEGLMLSGSNFTTPEPTTPEPTTPEPTEDGPILPFKALDFDWKNPSNWEYANGSPVPGDMVSQDGIKLTPANSPTPIRTKQGWSGEKIVYVEWERSASSDTNIWMLNTGLRGGQFAENNGWPKLGEIDIFEMFTQDKFVQPQYDFSGNMGFTDVSSYGQLTLHNGPEKKDGAPCFCPASHTKSAWFKNIAPMTSACTAQFDAASTKSMATIWGSDGNGKFLQLYQNPTITKGGKVNGVQTYDITPGGITTMKIYNNNELFWGTPASSPCAVNGGHNAATGFPFFEEFRLILEEQKKNDGSAWFKVNNVQIFKM